MDDSRPTRGFALTGLMCIGTLACGPDNPDAQDAGTTTGYPMTGTDGTDSNESGSSTGDETNTTGDPETGPETDTNEPSDCSYRGDICGELSVCQCSCDYSADCCYCDGSTCTEDSHCSEDEVCLVWVDQHWTNSQCVPAACAKQQYVYVDGPDADPSEFADVVCAWGLTVSDTALTDLTAFGNLQYVIGQARISGNPDLASLDGLAIKTLGTLEITYNDNLTSLDGLTSLESVEGGTVHCNGALPEAAALDTLAQIPGGENVYVSQNGQGPC